MCNFHAVLICVNEHHQKQIQKEEQNQNYHIEREMKIKLIKLIWVWIWIILRCVNWNASVTNRQIYIPPRFGFLKP